MSFEASNTGLPDLLLTCKGTDGSAPIADEQLRQQTAYHRLEQRLPDLNSIRKVCASHCAETADNIALAESLLGSFRRIAGIGPLGRVLRQTVRSYPQPET